MNDWIIKERDSMKQHYTAWHENCQEKGWISIRTFKPLACFKCHEILPDDILTFLKLLDDWWTQF